MSVENLARSIPDYAKDLKLNLTSISRSTQLNTTQLWGALLTAAITTRNQQIIDQITAEAKEKLNDTEVSAAQSAASIMGMNNIYYRFLHLSSNPNYQKLPAKLRMNAIRSHGIDQADFELWSLVASAMTGCSLCVDSHEKALKEHGFSEEQILEGVRIGAIVNGIAVALASANDPVPV